MSVDSNGFYERVPVFDRFSEIADPARYQPLPDDWHLGLADVVQSTKAIRENRYKAVNMAGASVIAAVANALGNRDFPFVFGGDGASFAVPPADAALARETLAATAAWVRDELSLNLRVALIPVADVRQHGLAVDIARFAPSPDVSYAMFSGGGIAWAEAAMKRGAYAIAPGPPGARPDLSGLSCRFSEIPAVRGTIMSLLVVPAVSPDATYRDFIARLVQLIESSPDVSRPVPDGAGDLRWPPEGLELEVRATRRAGGSLLLRRAVVLIATAISYCVLRFNIKVGSFVPTTYLRQLRDNSDFRKYDDALRMVLDCTPALVRAIEARLAAAASAGIVRYGIHQQDRAMMTCFTPSAFRNDHVHFIDGALGGYALAASALKGEHATATAHSG
ncbi:MAG TPA: DUF3095 domain-containing protein [Xanthobacteraceae bacterium]|nr:DUF3095 domain-containing protein [Xanthobacteraceae bacterium]